jgi:hypothetical protein
MGNRLIFLYLVECDGSRVSSVLIGLVLAAKRFQEIAPPLKTVPETDTGGQVEYTKALERRMLKELGKLPPYLRKKEALFAGNRFEGAQARG